MKSFKILLTPSAKSDISEMIDYLSQFYPSTALNQYNEVIEQIEKLKQFPLICEEYVMVMGFTYRKMIAGSYLIFYIVLDDTVEIHRIINAKSNIERLM